MQDLALMFGELLEEKAAEPPGIRHSEIVRKDGTVTIPEGYRWCAECDALSPHLGRNKYSSVCAICGDINFRSSLSCPTCGRDATPEVEAMEELEYWEKVHKTGCHFDEQQLSEGDYEDFANSGFFVSSWAEYVLESFFERNFGSSYAGTRVYKNLSKGECGCPEFQVFRHLNVFNHWSYRDYQGEYNSGCSVRCKICGTIFHVH
jgi:hypothetical protein